MFESAEVGHSIDKDTYEKAVIELREALLEAQFELKQQARFPVIILINGIEGAGKGETVKLLNEWMDPRLIEVQSFLRPSDEELERPPQWRFWRRLPPGADRYLLRQLVQPDALRAGRGAYQGGQAGPGHRCRRTLRAHALRRRRAALQVLVPSPRNS